LGSQGAQKGFVNRVCRAQFEYGIHFLVLPQNLWVDFRTWRPEQLPGQ
jgi:hypothetical protein